MEEQLDLFEGVDRTLFPGSLTIRALRDSRYHNTAYAIAELIDNSIEAGARHVELLCMEDSQFVQERSRQRLSALAVLDDGDGMDPETLIDALRFGAGTRRNTLRGIGKYGMGLPTASMSQGKRVEVWTWENGIDAVWYAYIDADEIEAGESQVPRPNQHTPIPRVWMQTGSREIFSRPSGTLVVWSKLDKNQWKTGRAVIDNTESEVSRIHRHFIKDGDVHIRAAAFRSNQAGFPFYERAFQPNDPLYLMAPSSVPEAPWDTQPMFTPWRDPVRYKVVTDEGKEETVTVTYSIVKPEALRTENPGLNPGTYPRGKHARRNLGVSVIREGREIVLEDAFQREGGSSTNPENRWWGCEVSFGRNCDELFGVDHNKQQAATFSHVAKALARYDGSRDQEFFDEMGIGPDDENAFIYELVRDIRDQTRAMLREITRMFEQRRSAEAGRRTRERLTPEVTAVQAATQADNAAVATGAEKPTVTDEERKKIPPEQREADLTQQFIEAGQPAQDAQELAHILVTDGISYRFNPAQLDGDQIFNVRSSNGILHINLNTDHDIYDLLQDVEGSPGAVENENDPAYKATVAIRLLLAAWARMEDQTEARQERRQIQNIAVNWGRQVAKMLSQWRDRTG